MERQLRTPGCGNATSGIVGTNIAFSECTNDPGYRNINKCGTLTGKLQLLGFGKIYHISVKVIVFSASVFKQYFSYVMAASFIGGGNRRKPTTCRISLTKFIT